MKDAEEGSFVASDYDELDLTSDSNTESTSDSDSNSGGDNSDRDLIAPSGLNNNWTIQDNARSRFLFTGQPVLQTSSTGCPELLICNTYFLISFFDLFFDD